MNAHKHMEAIFVVTLVVVTTGTLAYDSFKEADGVESASVQVEAARTVVVRAPTPARQA